MSEIQKAEATGAREASFDWRGHTFTVPLHRDDWSVDMLESFEEGKAVGAVRGALGPAQWRVVKGMNLKVRDLNDLADKIAAALGFNDAGESSASSD